MAKTKSQAAFDALFTHPLEKKKASDVVIPSEPEHVSRQQELQRVIIARRLQGWTDEEIYIRYFKL